MALRVLAVDDDRILLEGLKDVIEMERPDWIVVTAADVRSAQRLLRDGEPFDLILCDLRLPDGSGVDVARDARQQPWGAAAIIGCISIDEDLHEVFDFGLHKPFYGEQLFDEINRMLDAR